MWLDGVRRADRWRRRLRTLGALTTLLAMAGCSIGAPPSPADDAADNHLTVWVMQDDLSEQTLDAITARFTKTSGATVDVQIQPWDGIATKLTTAWSPPIRRMSSISATRRRPTSLPTARWPI